MQRVMYLRDQLRPVKNVSFDYSGALLAVSCTDGVVYVYSLSSEEPQLVKRVDGLISLLDSESEASAKVAWHPDGRAFGAANAQDDVQNLARSDWLSQKGFNGHSAKITASAWSPNGALLATAAADKSLILWETRTQKILKK
jgi:chromosome transmission fidelity protein 4